MAEPLTPAQIQNLAVIRNKFRAVDEHRKYNAMEFFRPYGKQLEFCTLGAFKKTRMFSAGNQLGKSDWGAYETAVHLTGRYPAWWTGVRFDHPIVGWAVGMSAGATRDILQAKLCGAPMVDGALGTGMIPKDDFAASPASGRGIAGSYDMIQVTWHRPDGKPGGVSTLVFKSYEQGWKKFQGTTIDWIWMDEEPDDVLIFSECQTRTLATRGSLIITFTPLNGETELWTSFAHAHKEGKHKDPKKGYVTMTGDDVLAEPHSHLQREAYEADVASWPAYLREAKRNGLPTMGSGSVFEFTREAISFPRFHAIPGHFRTGWGVDFGGMGASTGDYSHPFGAVLGTYDPLTDTIYIIQAIRLEHMLPINHADAMKRVCAAAPVFWPHDGHRTSGDDKTTDTAGLYKQQNLRMWSTHATFKNGGYSTETGLLEMQQRFASGRLKICDDLENWWQEYINYHRDDDGDLVKLKDDLMSATRILCMMLPRYGLMVPMGNLDGRHWRDGTTAPRSTIADGVDDDHWGM